MFLWFKILCNEVAQVARFQVFLLVLLLLLMPLGMATVKSWASTVIILLSVVSGVIWWRTRGGPSGKGKILLAGLICFFLACLVSLVNAEDVSYGFSRLGKFYPLLFAVPVYVAVGRFGGELVKVFVAGLSIAAVINLSVALYATQVMDLPRAKGYYHPIIFGDLSMTVAVLLVCAFLCLFEGKGVTVWLAVASLGALVAAILSETRGAWAAPVLVIVVLITAFRQHLKTKAVVAASAVVLVFFLLLPVVFPNSVGKQISRTRDSVESFIAGEHVNSSLGQRFLMWDVAIDVWMKNPWIGSGLGDFKSDTSRQILEGKTRLTSAWMHAHSIFFEALATTGIFGLLSMVAALFVFPFGMFVASWREADSPPRRFSALGGMALVVCFFSFGLSEAWLARSVFVAVYAVFGAFLLAMVNEVPSQLNAIEEEFE